MKEVFYNKKIYKYIDYACVIILISILAAVYISKIYTAIITPYPLEYREMNTIAFADLFAKGINPYSPSILESEIPTITSVYGFIPSLLCSIFIKLFSSFEISAVIICRVLTIIVEIICILLIFLTVKQITGYNVISLTASVLCCGCFWRYSAFGGAFTDQWGMLFNSLLMYCVIRDEKKEKYNPVLYALILVVDFYTKQYFIFSVIGLIIYLYIHSKKDIVKLIIAGMSFTIISLLLVNMIFPLFLSEVLPIMEGTTDMGTIFWSLNQIPYLIKNMYLIPFLFIFLLLILLIITKKTSIIKKTFKSYAFWQAVGAFFPTLYISLDLGAYAIYLLQLWFFYVVIFFCEVIHCCINENKIISVKLNKNDWINPVIQLLMVLLFIYQVRSYVFAKPYSSENIREWESAYCILDKYQNDGEILADTHLSMYMFNNNLETSEYGMCEYNGIECYNNIISSPIWSKFNYAISLTEKNIKYEQKIKEKIKDKEYACIALSTIYRYNITDEYLVECGYKCIAINDLQVGAMIFDTYFWVSEV